MGLDLTVFPKTPASEEGMVHWYFGGYLGFEIVDPGKLTPKLNMSDIELTKFLLFNKEVTTGSEGFSLEKKHFFLR